MIWSNGSGTQDIQINNFLIVHYNLADGQSSKNDGGNVKQWTTSVGK